MSNQSVLPTAAAGPAGAIATKAASSGAASTLIRVCIMVAFGAAIMYVLNKLRRLEREQTQMRAQQRAEWDANDAQDAFQHMLVERASQPLLREMVQNHAQPLVDECHLACRQRTQHAIDSLRASLRAVPEAEVPSTSNASSAVNSVAVSATSAAPVATTIRPSTPIPRLPPVVRETAIPLQYPPSLVMFSAGCPVEPSCMWDRCAPPITIEELDSTDSTDSTDSAESTPHQSIASTEDAAASAASAAAAVLAPAPAPIPASFVVSGLHNAGALASLLLASAAASEPDANHVEHDS